MNQLKDHNRLRKQEQWLCLRFPATFLCIAMLTLMGIIIIADNYVQL